MKKHTRRAPATTKAASTMPAGLQHAFKLIETDGTTSIAARLNATRAYPPAVKVIAALHGNHRGTYNDAAIENELTAAAVTFYGKDAATDPAIAADAAFLVGFAVCWLLLHSINGGAR